MNATEKAADLKCTLAQFCGTTQWYRSPLGLLYTDGIKYLADEAGAYWLIDAIASYQPKLRRKPGLAEFQVWILNRNTEDTGPAAVLLCYDDMPGKVQIRQEIEYTEFPLDRIKLCVENNVLLLPSEH